MLGNDRRHAGRRLIASAIAVLAVAASVVTASTYGADYEFPKPVPKADCGPGAKPETDIQGRVPAADFDSHRAYEGYQCNARQVSHFGVTGGFKVQRYVDRAGNTCAYYDSTALLPKDVLAGLAGPGLGVVVLDMNDPAKPRKTANLLTPAMLSPHESVLLNQRRGLLAAIMGSPLTQLGIVDVYDVKQDCRHPKLLSSSPVGILGHESGWAPDGKTFYTTGAASVWTAIDMSDPRNPQRIYTDIGGPLIHGMRLSNDGRTLYQAMIGTAGPGGITGSGLRILDASEIQDRKPDPEVHLLADLTWREVSLPQAAEPFTRNGHQYLLEVDEYQSFSSVRLYDPTARVGAARIINVDNPRRPFVVSNIRLQVHQPWARKSEQMNDPGAKVPVQGYTAHYCSVPYRKNPRIVACSMNLSGLRVFDISDLEHPREVAYFNRPIKYLQNPLNPIAIAAYAMSQNTWDVERRSIWYTDVNSGFYVVKLTNGVGKLLERR